MKKKFLIFVIMILALFVFNVKASNKIKSIDMDVYVDKSGDAYITEEWNAVLDQGTEGYHPYFNMGNSKISDFKVTEGDTTFSFVENWNINASKKDKTNKNGIYYDGDEVDLCFGIGEYGSHTYKLSYKISNYIYNTSDNKQILFWTLIPQHMSSSVGKYYIKIHSDFEYDKDLPVWGYGKYGAYAYVYDGYIELTADKSLSTEEYVTVLVEFPAGTFDTTNSIKKSFDDVKAGAEKGATKYKQKSSIWKYLPTVLVWVAIFAIGLFAAKGSKKDKIANKVNVKKDVKTFRELPCKDDIFFAYFVSTEYKLIRNQTDFLGSLLLRWIKDGVVSVTTAEKGIFKTKSTKIVFEKKEEDVKFLNNKEIDMFRMMLSASNDGILEQNEFKKYCNNHYTKVLNWFDSVVDDEFNKIKDSKYILKGDQKQLLGTKAVYNATNELNEVAMQLAGLKKFFNEFGSIGDKSAIEVKMWREYLMYAQIFGVANKVAKEFKKIYPTEIMDTDVDTIILLNTFSTTSVSAATAARTRAQSYSAGGGGFSSGGGGGGSFGGGGGGGGFR